MNSIRLCRLLLLVTLLAACSDRNPLVPSQPHSSSSGTAALETSGRPQPAGLPFYARIESGFEPIHSAEWAPIIFYRHTTCVPTDFNLLDFFDIPRAFSCPLTVEGFNIFKEPLPAAPIQVNVEGLGAVPVWFVHWSELQTAISDGVLTIGELQAMSSLIVGTASSFREILHPAETLTIVAKGTLADGRQFSLEAAFTGTEPRHVRIAFD